MSYDRYVEWVAALKDAQLNDEILKLRKNVRDAERANRPGATLAWSRLLGIAQTEAGKRDSREPSTGIKLQ
jgi:hypothetical protein